MRKRHLVVFVSTRCWEEKTTRFSPSSSSSFYIIRVDVYSIYRASSTLYTHSSTRHPSVVALRSHVVVPLDFAPNGWANWGAHTHIRMCTRASYLVPVSFRVYSARERDARYPEEQFNHLAFSSNSWLLPLSCAYTTDCWRLSYTCTHCWICVLTNTGRK